MKNKSTEEQQGYKLVQSYWDLIEVDLYNNADKYSVINQPYWLKNSKGELEEYKLYFHFEGDEEPTLIKQWRNLKEHVENKIMYIKCQ
jgi:hypothetical protein